MFSYIGQGGAKTGGCAKIAFHPHSLWLVGNVLYVKAKALHGVLEKVAIKRILFDTNINNYSRRFIPVYMDTFNTLWNENELVLESEAMNDVAVYEAWLAQQPIKMC